MSCENEVNMLFSWCVVQSSLASIFSFLSSLKSQTIMATIRFWLHFTKSHFYTTTKKGKLDNMYVDYWLVGPFLVLLLPRKSSKSVVSRAICNRWRYSIRDFEVISWNPQPSNNSKQQREMADSMLTRDYNCISMCQSLKGPSKSTFTYSLGFYFQKLKQNFRFQICRLSTLSNRVIWLHHPREILPKLRLHQRLRR